MDSDAACLDRHVYRLRSRNLAVGVYSAKRDGFIGIRTKFGDQYLDVEYLRHTAWPIEDIGVLPEGIEAEERTPSVDEGSGRAVEYVGRELALDDPKRGWCYKDTGEMSKDIRPISRMHQPLFDHLEQVERDLSSQWEAKVQDRWSRSPEV